MFDATVALFAATCGPTFVLVIVACPVARPVSEAVNGRPTTTPELVPAGAAWMCAPVRVVPALKPVTWTVKSYVAPVMLLAASRVSVIVICMVPLAPASALLGGIGGTSLAGNRIAVNRATFGFAEGVVG